MSKYHIEWSVTIYCSICYISFISDVIYLIDLRRLDIDEHFNCFGTSPKFDFYPEMLVVRKVYKSGKINYNFKRRLVGKRLPDSKKKLLMRRVENQCPYPFTARFDELQN